MAMLRVLAVALALVVADAPCLKSETTPHVSPDQAALPDSFEETLQEAEASDADSQHKLGNMYCTGEEVAQDYREAVRWYTKAAEQGHAEAQYDLAVMYAKGWGVAEDEQQAVWWLINAADDGHAEAQFILGNFYRMGWDVPQDDKRALEWYTKAAEQGHADAQFNVGSAYHRGSRILRDREKAIKWYTKAAEQGDGAAQYSLGEIYLDICNDGYSEGNGVSDDCVQAYKWFNLPAAQDYSSSALDYREVLSHVMTREQIAEAQRLSNELYEKLQRAENDLDQFVDLEAQP